MWRKPGKIVEAKDYKKGVLFMAICVAKHLYQKRKKRKKKNTQFKRL